MVHSAQQNGSGYWAKSVGGITQPALEAGPSGS